MKARIAVAAALCVAIAGCASITQGTSQSVAVDTPGVPGAVCDLSANGMKWQVTTPGTLSVEKSSEDIQAVCKKPGYQNGVAVIPSNFDAWTAAGLLIPGGILWVGVDAATGAMNKYPKTFTIPMQPLSAAEVQAQQNSVTATAAQPSSAAAAMKPVAN